jgi:hypothetical protein
VDIEELLSRCEKREYLIRELVIKASVTAPVRERRGQL